MTDIIKQAQKDFANHALGITVLDAEAPKNGRAGVVFVRRNNGEHVCGFWNPGDQEWSLGIYGVDAWRMFCERANR